MAKFVNSYITLTMISPTETLACSLYSFVVNIILYSDSLLVFWYLKKALTFA